MSTDDPGETFGLLRAAARIAMVAGAAGSAGLMLRAGRRNPSHLLLVLFAIWVLSPFVALGWAITVSKRWSVPTRATLYGVTLVVALASLAIYGYVVSRPPRSTPAFAFIVVPLGSWLLMTTVVPIAASVSRRLARRGVGG